MSNEIQPQPDGQIDDRQDPETADALDDTMSGVWVVETRGSSHIWDLDNMTYTRRPGASSGSGGMLFDGNAMPITRVQAWPRVGESFFVWFDDPDDPDLLEHYRISSTVRRILPVEPVRPTDPAKVETHDEE